MRTEAGNRYAVRRMGNGPASTGTSPCLGLPLWRPFPTCGEAAMGRIVRRHCRAGCYGARSEDCQRRAGHCVNAAGRGLAHGAICVLACSFDGKRGLKAGADLSGWKAHPCMPYEQQRREKAYEKAQAQGISGNPTRQKACEPKPRAATVVSHRCCADRPARHPDG